MIKCVAVRMMATNARGLSTGSGTLMNFTGKPVPENSNSHQKRRLSRLAAN
jgi:hypothetical protein